MTSKQQHLEFLRQYIAAKLVAPWIAACADERAIECLQLIGGIAGDWRLDVSECTYYYPVMVAGILVDLSTIEKVRAQAASA
jgi:hypothetical protein